MYVYIIFLYKKSSNKDDFQNIIENKKKEKRRDVYKEEGIYLNYDQLKR